MVQSVQSVRPISHGIIPILLIIQVIGHRLLDTIRIEMSCFTTMVSWWTTRGSLNNPKPPQFSPSASPKRESQAMRSKANSSSSSSPRSYASFVRFTRWTLGWKNTWKKRCFFGTKKKHVPKNEVSTSLWTLLVG